MIVARGLGRGGAGRSLVAHGLGLAATAIPVRPPQQPGSGASGGASRARRQARRRIEDEELLLVIAP